MAETLKSQITRSLENEVKMWRHLPFDAHKRENPRSAYKTTNLRRTKRLTTNALRALAKLATIRFEECILIPSKEFNEH